MIDQVIKKATQTKEGLGRIIRMTEMIHIMTPGTVSHLRGADGIITEAGDTITKAGVVKQLSQGHWDPDQL